MDREITATYANEVLGQHTLLPTLHRIVVRIPLTPTDGSNEFRGRGPCTTSSRRRYRVSLPVDFVPTYEDDLESPRFHSTLFTIFSRAESPVNIALGTIFLVLVNFFFLGTTRITQLRPGSLFSTWEHSSHKLAVKALSGQSHWHRERLSAVLSARLPATTVPPTFSSCRLL